MFHLVITLLSFYAASHANSVAISDRTVPLN